MLTLEPESNLRPGDELALTCVAYGGFPETDVIWQDGGGRNLTDNVTTSLVANERGLFTMTSVLTVVLEPNSTYSCRLIHPLLGDEGYAFVTITGESGPSSPEGLSLYMVSLRSSTRFTNSYSMAYCSVLMWQIHTNLVFTHGDAELLIRASHAFVNQDVIRVWRRTFYFIFPSLFVSFVESMVQLQRNEWEIMKCPITVQ